MGVKIVVRQPEPASPVPPPSPVEAVVTSTVAAPAEGTPPQPEAATGRVRMSLKEFLAAKLAKPEPVAAQSVRQAFHELRETCPRKRLYLVNKVKGSRYPVFEVDSDYNAYVHHEARKFKFWLRWKDMIEAQYKPLWLALDGTEL